MPMPGASETVIFFSSKTAPPRMWSSLQSTGPSRSTFVMIFLAQASVIRKVADEGSCVIVGRCADYVLRDRKDCVNVFIHSDLASRIKRATEQYGLSPVKAGDEINKIDKQRATYYRYYSEKKWGRAENYDLSVYSDSIGLEACTDLILSFVDMKLSHRD